MTNILSQNKNELIEFEIYTDGACLGNPGPGGYAAIVKSKNVRKELFGKERNTTNNRMEIMAAIIGLESLEAPSYVKLYSDSRYLVDAITKGWVENWRRKQWYRTKNELAKNIDLWERMLKILSIHKVKFFWVKGHAENIENEKCDRLAVAAAKDFLNTI